MRILAGKIVKDIVLVANPRGFTFLKYRCPRRIPMQASWIGVVDPSNPRQTFSFLTLDELSQNLNDIVFEIRDV